MFILAQLRDKLRTMRQLFSSEFVFDEKCEKSDFDAALKFLIVSKVFSFGNETNYIRMNSRNDLVELILSSVSPFVCCYYHGAKTITSEVSFFYCGLVLRHISIIIDLRLCLFFFLVFKQNIH